jgi:hypothetical protein
MNALFRLNRSRLTLVTLAAVVLVAGAGCGRNKPGTVLAPTGIRPAPATWPGSLTGAVFFDPSNTPDLGAPPFPPTRIELHSGATVVAVDSLEPSSRNYLFTGLAPGTYSVVASSSAFNTTTRGGLPVHEDRLDAGNLTLTLNSASFSNGVDVMGSMPGFDTGQFGMGTTSLDQNVLGVWTYPNSLLPPTDIPAGTYRLKFVTDMSSTDNNLIGWGGSPGDTLTVPVVNALAVRGSGPATDLVVRFPATGTYAFTLDERRQRFSIALATPSPGFRSRRNP